MKKKTKRMTALAMAAVLAFGLVYGCTPAADGPGGDGGDGGDGGVPANPALSIDYAEQFDIAYLDDGVKLVTDSDGRDILLVPEGVAVPADYADLPLVATPISRGFFGSTTFVGLLAALGVDSVYDAIAAVATEQQSWTTPQVLDRFATGQIAYIPTDNWGVAEVETVLSLRTDIVFTTASPDLGRLTQYEEVGIVYAAVGEYMEKSNPAYLEWIKFFAAFYNLDELADEAFEAKLTRMQELAELTEGIADAERPVVAYAMVWDGTCYTQGSDSTTAKEVYREGGLYYLDDLTSDGSLTIGMEEFFSRARDADILIYSGLLTYTPDKAALLAIDPLFGEMRAFQNDQVYIYVSDYYMRNWDKEALFEDLVAIIHPELLPGHEQSLVIKLPD
jgi:iron complex transport system substrate-binding protein